jgi:hypothetical protein
MQSLLGTYLLQVYTSLFSVQTTSMQDSANQSS